MMGAVWTIVRSTLRKRARATVALAVLLGLAGGVVLSALAGARRTATSYSRLVAYERAWDAGVGSTGANGSVPLDVPGIRRLPEVAASEVCDAYDFLPLRHGRLFPVGEGNGVACRLRGPVKVLAGRLPDPRRPDEVALGFASVEEMADVFHHEVGPGTTFEATFLRPGADPTSLLGSFSTGRLPPGVAAGRRRLWIVGVTVGPDDLTRDAAYGAVQFTAAFDRANRDRFEHGVGVAVALRHGQADAERFARDVDRLTNGGEAGFGIAQDTRRLSERVIHPLAAALWIFGALAGVACLLIMGQALARQSTLESIEYPALRALGCTRRQLVATSVVRMLVVGALAAVLAVALAIALSPIMPIGRARVVEPHPGVAVDALVLGIGAAALVAVTVGATLLPGWRAAGARREAPAPSGRSALAGALVRAGLSPSAATGVRMALERGRGRTAVPVRATIVGLAISVGAVSGAVTFASSFDRLLGTPRLSGWDWDVGAGNAYGPDISRTAVPALRADERVAQFSGGNILTTVFLRAGGRTSRVDVWALDPVRGSVQPTVVAGAWPRDASEVALGSKTMAELGVGMGDLVTVHAGRRTARLRVVGQSVFPETGGGTQALGHGAGMTLEALRALVPRVPENYYLVRFVPKVDQAAATSDLNRRFVRLGGGVVRGARPTDLQNVGRVRGLPVVLAALLGLVGIATLAHSLIGSVRRRRRDLAVLKTVGFVRRQVRGAVAWQATVVAALALVVGVPVGIAAGRWAWLAFAGGLGVVPLASVPAAVALLIAPATILIANLVAAGPARSAARTAPAVVLRME
jgi:hypothetical protein